VTFLSHCLFPSALVVVPVVCVQERALLGQARGTHQLC
jgi:hypothetical protein